MKKKKNKHVKQFLAMLLICSMMIEQYAISVSAVENESIASVQVPKKDVEQAPGKEKGGSENTEVAPETEKAPVSTEVVPETEQQPDTQVPQKPEAEQQPDTQVPTKPDNGQQPETQVPSEPATEAGNTEADSTEAAVPETEVAPEESTEGNVKKELDWVLEKDMRIPAEEKSLFLDTETSRVIEVTDLASLMQAVSEVTADDDFTPAYAFTKDSAAAAVNGEEQQMEAPCQASENDFVVPESVFADDAMIETGSVTDGDGVVALSVLAETTSYEVVQQEEAAELSDPFQNKHLIVKSEDGFDPLNAETIIQGYDNLYILTYRTEEETKAAYEFLQTVPGLTVETESVFSGTAELMGAGDELAADISGINFTEIPISSRDIKVAVIDSGYDMNGSGAERILEGTDVTGSGTVQDENGHGTAMANIILEHSSDCIKVMPIKVSDANGRTSALKLYLGVEYAIANGADIINISMNAYQSSESGILKTAIQKAKENGIFVVVSAGNAGDDVSNYSPANVEEAIVVSAVNLDYTAMEYSNHGSAIDFSTYGKIAVRGMNQADVTARGTSVSAAIMSMQIAQMMLMDGSLSFDSLTERLQGAVRDLGEEGRDDVFGFGAITPEMITAIYDENICASAEIFSCDWKNMSDDAFNKIIADTNAVNLNKFIKDLSDEEKGQLLARNTVFSQKYEVLENVTADPSTCRYKEYDRYYDYLMEQEFSSSWITTGSANQSGYFYVQHNDAKRRVNASYKGLSTSDANPVPTVELAWQSDTAGIGINFENAKVGKGWGDENNIYLLMNVKVSGLDKHSYVKDGGTTNSGEHGGGYTDGFINCTEDKTSKGNIGLQVGLDSTGIKLVKSYEDKGNITALFATGHSVAKISTGNNSRKETSRKNPTCLTAGYIKYQCNAKDCTKWTEDIPSFGGHAWPGNTITQTNNGVPNGLAFEQCQRNCGESGWQRNFTYIQQIYYRYMDADGNYPGYTTHVNGYFPAGTYIGGCKHVDNGATEFQTAGIDAFFSPANANWPVYIDIPRKRYAIDYYGNGANGGAMAAKESICAGKNIQLDRNQFTRTGYDFVGWSKSPSGGKELSDMAAVVNLSLTHGARVALYAVWEPHIYTITLDNQGANLKPGTPVVYQKYVTGYFGDPDATIPFSNNKITMPEKYTDDASLIGKKRMMQFLGYNTGKDGGGVAMVKKDGSLIANIAGKSNFAYFTNDATVYAQWIPKNAVQFLDNLTDVDHDIVGNDKNNLPETKWKNKGEDITVNFETASLVNNNFAQIYRLKGWSLTPEIHSDDEIILSESKTSYTFSADEDVTLYAQWDTSFNVTYVGNTQSEGTDYLDGVASVRDDYTFTPGDKKGIAALEKPEADYFVKTIEKPTVDVETGDAEDENGNAYLETIAYSFQGWSMVKDKDRQNIKDVYKMEDTSYKNDKIILKAAEVSKEGKGEGLTFGEPVTDYGSYNAAHDTTRGLVETLKGDSLKKYSMDEMVKKYADSLSDTPFVNMYAIWDQFPQIDVADMYFPLADAQNGILTEEFLLNEAKATDEELKSASNAEGILKNGADEENKTSFTIQDYQESDFAGAGGNTDMTITYQAEDSVGNVTTKTIRVHLVDTIAQKFDAGSVRFISKEYADTLDEDSIWRTGEFATKLAGVLGNSKSGEEYTTVSAAEKAFGAKPVLKPGSGDWSHEKQVWEFTHDQVQEVQEYVKDNGIMGSQEEFLTQFGSCRVK